MDSNLIIQILSSAILLMFFIPGLYEVKKLTRELERRDEWLRLKDRPDTIEAEMERTADLREVRDANRTTLPREDAGPPAVVYRPKLRGQKPGSWRPRTSTVFQKIERGDD